MNTMIEHHIQRDILLRLMRSKTVRFSSLKPEGMESNSFMYHLKQLIQIGYVTQLEDKSYSLTPSGLSYIDRLSLTNSLPRKQPKLLCIIALRNKAGEYLFAKRLMQPTIGSWMLPSGKQHFGESSEDHAKREVIEQFGVKLELKRRGLLDIRISHDDVLVSHLVAQVYSGEFEGNPPADTEKFHYEWRSSGDSIPFTAGTRELIDALEQKPDYFFLSLDVDAD